MKLYHYISKGNTALTNGILSFANNPSADIHYYIKRSGADNKEGIVKWMESCFEGRSRGIRGFTETIKWHEKSLCLKKFIDNADLFSIDLEALEKDGLIESVWHSPSVLDVANVNKETCIDELLNKIDSIKQINFSPLNWGVCDDEKGWRFSFVRYYLIVIKGGVIPPKYIRKEN